MLPEWFSLALDARVKRELMWFIYDWHGCEPDDFGRYRNESWDAAKAAGYLIPDADIPLLLQIDEELETAFVRGQSLWHEERYEEKEAQLRAEKKANLDRRIAEKDWAALSLPAPADLLNALLKGEVMTVGGHRLSPDNDGVWLTNPYGIDCGLWQEPDLELIEGFLVDMARDEEYGPVPY